METPTWQKTEMTCKCGKDYKPAYRNGILISKLCPNCQLKSMFNPKNVRHSIKPLIIGLKPEKRQKTPRQKAMDKADKVFSQYIRVKFAFESGGELFCRDIITGHINGIKFMDNGHCFSRSFKATRFEEDNCRPQNRSSNRFSGEADHYKFIKNLKAEIGPKRFELIEELKDQECRDSETFYKLHYETYKFLLKEILTERGWENPWKK